MAIPEPEPPRESPVPEPRWATRELRLAIVCYGGVSLAIYMHGVTKEIHKLVLASAALEEDPDKNPFDEDTTERVYWDILSRISQDGLGGHSKGAKMRVVVDIITGTSAGGINGIFLAKALTGNRPQDGLRKLWFEKGDIKHLLEWPTWIPWQLRFLAMTVARRKPPLRGGDMSKWLYGALRDMNGKKVLEGAESLLPDDHILDLYVPITDFLGYERDIPLYDPRFVRDRTHRHVMHFRHQQPAGATASHFSADFDHVLAFSARATSSFPGAFPPVSFGDYAAAVGVDERKAFEAAPFFPLYRLADFQPENTHFIDGGVLDNFPFGPAIAAIASKPAATDVDRRLIFIEPDPGEGGEAPPDRGPAPGLLKTVFGGYAGIPRKEPILDDLLHLAERNEAVLRIRDVIEASFPSIRAKVDDLVKDRAAAAIVRGASGDSLMDIRRNIEALAVQEANFNAATYLRVRIRSVLEGYADAVAQMLDFPADSHQAAFVAGVLRAWAVSDKLLEQQPDLRVTDAQVEFLSSFDIRYHGRRVRFLIAALSWLYSRAGEGGVPSRRELDVAKAKLYAHVFSLDAILAALAADPDIDRDLREIFSKDTIAAANLDDEFDVRPFVDHHRTRLESVREKIRRLIVQSLPAFEEGLQSDLLDFTDRLDDNGAWLRSDLLTRYLGFPFWDMLVFPLQTVAALGERDHVEAYRISPNETRLLGAQDLKGMSLFHFGAFFDRAGREGDYLWGRLDAVERLVKLLLDVRGHPPTLATGAPAKQEPLVRRDELATECVPAFRAILAEEGPSLPNATKLVAKLQDRVDALSAGASPAP
ncbi:MAG TPA: patatin-like protein [Acidimicrobiales bacterium]|nr:patatin-like protein [Acidimicrobiales bacterium]